MTTIALLSGLLASKWFLPLPAPLVAAAVGDMLPRARWIAGRCGGLVGVACVCGSCLIAAAGRQGYAARERHVWHVRGGAAGD
jgi:hypothetical protein